MTTSARLLRTGYFPRELPPPFTSGRFGVFVSRHRSSLTVPQKNWTDCVRHNLGRPDGRRRPLRIPNPRGYIPLTEHLEAEWGTLNAHLTSEHISQSRPIISRRQSRAVMPLLAFGELPKLRAQRWRGSRYILRTDINQFYPTVYTHSIPWALVGKAQAKAQIANNLAPYGDDLDRLSRNIQLGQTVGLPIGPDSSLIIAECILTSIDRMLRGRLGTKVRGFRYVDDYEIGFPTYGAAEEGLAALHEFMGVFELSLNSSKTGIGDLPSAIQPRWLTELQSFSIRSASAKMATTDLVSYFSHAFEIAEGNRQHAVLRYALSRARSIIVSQNAGWHTLEGMIMQAATADPSSMPVVLALLAKERPAGKKIRLSMWADVLEAIVERDSRLGLGSEVAWAIWAACELGVNLSDSSVASLGTMDDDIVALTTLDALDRGRIAPGAVNLTLWTASAAAPDALVRDHWLLAYEANRHGWLSAPAVLTDPFFSVLAQGGVWFYDARRRSGFSGAAAGLPGGRLSAGYV